MKYEPKELTDGMFAFDAGVNMGFPALLLPPNQLANAVNVTVRRGFATHRPNLRKIALTFTSAETQSAFETMLWQGGCVYDADAGNDSLIVSISGKLFKVTPDPVNATATVSIVSTPTTQQLEFATQCWLWQSEKWVIWNDGVSNPVFFDGTTTSRSNWNTPIQFSTTTAADFDIPAIGATTPAFAFTATADLTVGDLVTVPSKGTLLVQTIAGANVTLVNVTATPEGQTVASGTTVSWTHQLTNGEQLPPGRMGVYGMGRNWFALVDGKQFVASDLVGGASGTQAENYRDAVLNITENLYLAGGGTFTVPGSIGAITAMRFAATLDSALGQGPLQVFTASGSFSCNAPTDRLTWQTLTNPILTESLKGFGAKNQNGTINANSDITFRSIVGSGSLILGRRDFNTWGNVPTSQEMEPIYAQDNSFLLQHGSAVVFDNRELRTSLPIQTGQGVYHRGIVALNFDPLSSLRGKQPSVYDGLWEGLNVLQLLASEDFNGVERCFAFSLNTIDNKIELYEILKAKDAHYDNNGVVSNIPVVWLVESPVLFGPRTNQKRELVQLSDGEIYVDDVKGAVNFKAYYKPDQWPCWVPWFEWDVCAAEPTGVPSTANYKPGFRPIMGLGEPSSEPCDEPNNRTLRNGYSFQMKLIITGHCRFLGARVKGNTLPTPVFAKQICPE